MFINAARAMSRFSPTLNRIGLMRVLGAIENYLAFLSGRGSGSGWDGVNEVKSTARFINKQSPVIFDVGANDGRWSVDIAKILNQKAQFYLFEPMDYCKPGYELRRSMIPNSKFIPCAVGDKNGAITIYAPCRGSGLASAYKRRDTSIKQEKYREVIVPIRTIDSLCQELGLLKIDLLKMDIEGNELNALKGARRMLQRRGISVIQFEFGSACINSRVFFIDYFDLFEKYGFNIYRILPGGDVLEIKNYSETLEYFRGASNYIAVLRDS